MKQPGGVIVSAILANDASQGKTRGVRIVLDIAMDDFEFPSESWREQIAEVTQTLSKLADFGKLSAMEFSKLNGEAMQRTIDTIRSSTEVLQEVFVVHQLQDAVNRCVESQAAFNSEFFSRINQATVHFQSEMQKTWTVIGKATAEAMERTRSALARVELLASLGWTLPMGMSLPEFHALVMQDHLTVENVDAWFLEYFSDEAEFTPLRKRLLGSEQLQFWRPLLEQAFRAYASGEYAICVPAMLCVLEGSIAVSWGVAFQKERNRKKFFAQNIEAAHEDWINHYLWKSVASFIDTIFETGVSDKQEHPVPKRNLILHGKSDPAKWNQADCLRLFQSIDSILSLYGKRP